VAQPEARALLASLLFRGDRVFERIRDLSGGEATRILFLDLLVHETNLLLLDEPTNHLDLPARERLEEALDAYTGTLVVASHDRFLLDRLCTTIWAIVGDTITAFDGNYAAFRSEGGFRPPAR
jgi:ATP-binding cassette subfamily F protein 3